MEEKIKELYQRLCEENKLELEANKVEVQYEKSEKNRLKQKNRLKSNIVSIIITIGTPILFFAICTIMLPIMQNTMTDNSFGRNLLWVLPVIVILSMIILAFRIIKPKNNIDDGEDEYEEHVDYKEKYNNVFCEKICKPIIEYVIPNSIYIHNDGVSREKYENMGFSNSHDEFRSTDSIKLNNDDSLILSKVYTKLKDDYVKYLLFAGIISIKTIESNIPLNIKIRNKSLPSLKLKNAIEFENREFSEYYEIETDNLELLNKYITKKIINYLIKLAEKDIRIEINISDNHIYIRLFDKDFLQFDVKDENCEEKIMNDCSLILTMINVNNLIVNELEIY